MVRSIGWLVDWVIGWLLVDWWLGWLIDWLGLPFTDFFHLLIHFYLYFLFICILFRPRHVRKRAWLWCLPSWVAFWTGMWLTRTRNRTSHWKIQVRISLPSHGLLEFSFLARLVMLFLSRRRGQRHSDLQLLQKVRLQDRGGTWTSQNCAKRASLSIRLTKR